MHQRVEFLGLLNRLFCKMSMIIEKKESLTPANVEYVTVPVIRRACFSDGLFCLTKSKDSLSSAPNVIWPKKSFQFILEKRTKFHLGMWGIKLSSWIIVMWSCRWMHRENILEYRRGCCISVGVIEACTVALQYKLEMGDWRCSQSWREYEFSKY